MHIKGFRERHSFFGLRIHNYFRMCYCNTQPFVYKPTRWHFLQDTSATPNLAIFQPLFIAYIISQPLSSKGFCPMQDTSIIIVLIGTISIPQSIVITLPILKKNGIMRLHLFFPLPPFFRCWIEHTTAISIINHIAHFTLGEGIVKNIGFPAPIPSTTRIFIEWRR